MFLDCKTFLCDIFLRLTVNDMTIVLGNEKLSLLTTNRKYKLRIELEDFVGEKRWAEYSTFFRQSING